MADPRPARRSGSSPARDRAVAPATGKLLEVALVVLYIGLVSTALYGGVVPQYRSAAGDAVAERTLATASQRVQQAVPPNGTHVEATTTVALPDTIRGRAYAIRADGRRLALEHPNPTVEGATRLALPDGVHEVSGRWSSTEPALIEVHGSRRGLSVTLRRGGR